MYEFKVSVIIPVYNAVDYIERAIESVIHQGYLGEIVIIDDGYSDGALDICLQLEKTYEKVKVYQHPDGENRGASASRNLGILKAKFEYIAFLDADDYYLPNRFVKTAECFLNNSEVTAVYEPVGTEFSDEKAKLDFCKWRKISKMDADSFITYMKGDYKGEEFVIQLLKGNKGSIHINGLTLNKSVLLERDLFNTNLSLHQDSELWVRLSYLGCFWPVANPSTVAIRFAHLENRITNRNFKSIYLKEKQLYSWAKESVHNNDIYNLILKRYIYSLVRYKFDSSSLFVMLSGKIIFTFAKMFKINSN